MIKNIKTVVQEYKKLPAEEKTKFWKLLFLPYLSTADNVKAWITISIHVIFVVVGVNILWHLPATSLVQNFVIGYASMSMILFTVSNSLLTLDKGLRERDAIRKKEETEKLQNILKAVNEQLIANLKKTSGREHINEDPISIMAASLDAQDKKVHRPETPDNPLKDVLDDDN